MELGFWQGISIRVKSGWKQAVRYPLSGLLRALTLLAAACTMVVLVVLVGYILIKGVPNLKLSLFEWEYNSNNVSMLPAIINTITMVALTLVIAVPVGIGSAIYLVEYAKKGNKLVKLIRLMNETLAGIPSIVFGLFGYLMFVISCGFSNSILAGALTLSMMVLPTIQRTAEEAMLSVPDSYREASFGLGAGKLRTIFRIVLPTAMTGIVAGVILAVGRIVGETAALIYTSGTVAGVPKTLMGSGRTLSVHMYALLSEGLYMNEAYATAVILLILVFLINLASDYLAKKVSKGKEAR